MNMIPLQERTQLITMGIESVKKKGIEKIGDTFTLPDGSSIKGRFERTEKSSQFRFSAERKISFPYDAVISPGMELSCNGDIYIVVGVNPVTFKGSVFYYDVLAWKSNVTVDVRTPVVVANDFTGISETTFNVSENNIPAVFIGSQTDENPIMGYDGVGYKVLISSVHSIDEGDTLDIDGRIYDVKSIDLYTITGCIVLTVDTND